MDTATDKLAEDLEAKVIANADVIERSNGTLNISVHCKGKGFEIKLGVSL